MKHLLESLVMVLGGMCLGAALRVAIELWRTRKDNDHDIDTRNTGAY
jgi:hypothetical protein